jgi:ribosomal protein S18 acetylase RimI-like enzyme
MKRKEFRPRIRLRTWPCGDHFTYDLFIKNKQIGVVSVDDATITDLDIHPNYRKMGFAKLLLNRIIHDHGHRELTLYAEPDNDSIYTDISFFDIPKTKLRNLQKLYREFGFRGRSAYMVRPSKRDVPT